MDDSAQFLDRAGSPRTRNRFAAAVALAGCFAAVGVTAAAPEARAAATCSSGVSVYGVTDDGKLTYSVIDPDRGDLTKVVTSSATLGFTAKAIAALNFNTVLVTSTTGGLYRVDVTTNSNSLAFNAPLRIEGGWTHDKLAYDGHGHLYGLAGGTLMQYNVSRPKPGADQIGGRREIGGGFALKTMTTTGDDLLVATTSAGALLTYHISATGYVRSELDDAGWSAFNTLVSPGGGLYYGRMPDGAMYWYEDDDPADGKGSDVGYHRNDPVSSKGWTQTLLSAVPATCTTDSVAGIRSKITAAAKGEVGTGAAGCNTYHKACDKGRLAWCAMFATWTWHTAGVADVPRDTFLAQGLGLWGLNNNRFKKRSTSARSSGSPKPGDWVIYGPPAAAAGGHVDVVVQVRPDGHLVVVGGNVSKKVTQRVIDPAIAYSGDDSLPISGYVAPPGAAL